MEVVERSHVCTRWEALHLRTHAANKQATRRCTLKWCGLLLLFVVDICSSSSTTASRSIGMADALRMSQSLNTHTSFNDRSNRMCLIDEHFHYLEAAAHT